MAEQDKDKWQGRGKNIAGNIKEKAGQLTDDEEMEAEGRADRAKGKAQEAWGETKEKAEGAWEKTKEKAGEVRDKARRNT